MGVPVEAFSSVKETEIMRDKERNLSIRGLVRNIEKRLSFDDGQPLNSCINLCWIRFHSLLIKLQSIWATHKSYKKHIYSLF